MKKQNYNFVDALKEYFKNTPKEQVLKDWEKTTEYDMVEVPMNEFLDIHNKNNKVYNPRTCNECPFVNVHYDDFAIGCDRWLECSLLSHSGDKSFLGCDDMWGEKGNIEIPSKCPLRKESVTVTLKII